MSLTSLYSVTSKKQEIEPKQEVKMTDNVVNTTCVALLIVRAVACQTVRGEH
jgi:hypothetical protein